MKRKILVVFVLLSLVIASLSARPASESIPEDITLTVLHTNDVHSHLDVDYKGRYGIGKVASEVARIRSDRENVLLLDAGDFVMGTIYYTIFEGMAEQEILNMMAYDAMTLGNHEFDKGPSELADYLSELDSPIVSTNINFSNEPDVGQYVVPYLIKTLEDRDIAILGATTLHTTIISSPGENISFEPVVPAIQNAVDTLEARGVDIVILLSHCGYTDDVKNAALLDGVDIIVGGHSHSDLGDGYPDVLSSASGEPVLVVQASEYAKLLGNLEVVFDGGGIAQSWIGAPILMSPEIPVDAEIGAYVSELNEELIPITSQVLGSTDVELIRSRTEESNIGNLIADAMLEYLADQDIQIALTNAGGIRADLGAGDISMQMVMEVLPFGNLASTFEIKGSDLILVFEQGLSGIETNEGRFLQMAGARITYDPSKSAYDYMAKTGGRIVSVEVSDSRGGWMPLDEDAIYKVAANNYIRGGGDGYQALKELAIDPYDNGPLDVDILSAYLKNHSPVSPGMEGRIRIVQ